MLRDVPVIVESEMPPSVPPTFPCRWDRKLEPGEEPKWFYTEAENAYQAAHIFAVLCDGKNPRPPAKRVVLIRTPEGEKKIQVTVRAALAYEVVGI